MPNETKQFSVTSAKYIKIGTSGDFVENQSSYPLRIIYSDTNIAPNPDALGYHFIKGGKSLKDEENILSGDMYARCEKDNVTANIAVTTIDPNPFGQVTDRAKLQCLIKDALTQLRVLNLQIDEAFETDITKEDLDERH